VAEDRLRQAVDLRRTLGDLDAIAGAIAMLGSVLVSSLRHEAGLAILEPAVEELRALVPYPPRLVVSSLGERAVLAGALAVGLELAVDRLFENRTIPLRSRTPA
jgi:hypothetical protein